MIAMGVMSLVLGIVALVTFFLLIPIGQAWQEAAIGAAVVVLEIAALALIVGLLSLCDPKKL